MTAILKVTFLGVYGIITFEFFSYFSNYIQIDYQEFSTSFPEEC